MRALEYFIVDVFTAGSAGGQSFGCGDGFGGTVDGAACRLSHASSTCLRLHSCERRPGAVERGEGVRVRIFTTQEELPFAGHPTLGTASVLKLNAPETVQEDTVTLALNVGPDAGAI